MSDAPIWVWVLVAVLGLVIIAAAVTMMLRQRATQSHGDSATPADGDTADLDPTGDDAADPLGTDEASDEADVDSAVAETMEIIPNEAVVESDAAPGAADGAPDLDDYEIPRDEQGRRLDPYGNPMAE
ncbi:MAG: hypothetical protein ACK5KO_11125 [Arachnia sp.]